MSQWRIDTDGRTRAVDEATLREELRDGRLSGAERVRAPDGTAWMPLHAHAIFAEEVPTGRPPQRRADGRIARGWLVHLATFFVVVLWAGKGTIPVWAMFWAIGLFAHTLRGLPALGRSLQSKGAASPTRLHSGASPQETAVPVRQVEFPSAQVLSAHAPTAFLKEVDAAVREVEGVWKRGATALGASPDLDGLLDAARRLDERHRALDALHRGEDRTSLAAQLDAARQQESSALDPVTAEVHSEEARAIEERLDGIDAARTVADQLAARKRTLLHQLAGLKLVAGQAAATHEGIEPGRASAPLVEKTAALRDALKASSEVDDALARARQAAAARHRTPS